MMKKHTYQTARVQQVQVAELLPLLAAGCIIALDVAKQRFVVALMTLAGEVAKLFRFDHPTETRDFLHIVEALRAGVGEGKVTVAMEPTGTYGDAIRYQMMRAGVPVRMVLGVAMIFSSLGRSNPPPPASCFRDRLAVTRSRRGCPEVLWREGAPAVLPTAIGSTRSMDGTVSGARVARRDGRSEARHPHEADAGGRERGGGGRCREEDRGDLLAVVMAPNALESERLDAKGEEQRGGGRGRAMAMWRQGVRDCEGDIAGAASPPAAVSRSRVGREA
jgi:hypothetical protein